MLPVPERSISCNTWKNKAIEHNHELFYDIAILPKGELKGINRNSPNYIIVSQKRKEESCTLYVH